MSLPVSIKLSDWLAHLLTTWVCSVVGIFLQFIPTASCSSQPLPHHPPINWMITTQAREDGPAGTMQTLPHHFQFPPSYACAGVLYSCISFTHCRGAPTIIPRLHKATFTASIQYNLCLLSPQFIVAFINYFHLEVYWFTFYLQLPKFVPCSVWSFAGWTQWSVDRPGLGWHLDILFL